MKRGLQRREAESVTKMGVDEKAFRKGHSYFTLVNDLVRGRSCTWPKDGNRAAWTASERP